MEPRPFRRGNTHGSHALCLYSVRFNGATSFQTWKPDLVVEKQPFGVASMEPRPFRRGNCMALASVCGVPKSFNGATSFQTWKRYQEGAVCNSNSSLQCFHVLSDVETLCRRTARKSASPCFNGATSFQTWKHATRYLIMSGRAVGFNGATSFQTWKRGAPAP